MMHVRWIEPIKEISPRYPIKFHQVAYQMLIDYRRRDTTDGVFLQYASRLFRISYVGDVFPMNGVEISPFDPAIKKPAFSRASVGSSSVRKIKLAGWEIWLDNRRRVIFSRVQFSIP